MIPDMLGGSTRDFSGDRVTCQPAIRYRRPATTLAESPRCRTTTFGGRRPAVGPAFASLVVARPIPSRALPGVDRLARLENRTWPQAAFRIQVLVFDLPIAALEHPDHGRGAAGRTGNLGERAMAGRAAGSGLSDFREQRVRLRMSTRRIGRTPPSPRPLGVVICMQEYSDFLCSYGFLQHCSSSAVNAREALEASSWLTDLELWTRDFCTAPGPVLSVRIQT